MKNRKKSEQNEMCIRDRPCGSARMTASIPASSAARRAISREIAGSPRVICSSTCLLYTSRCV